MAVTVAFGRVPVAPACRGVVALRGSELGLATYDARLLLKGDALCLHGLSRLVAPLKVPILQRKVRPRASGAYHILGQRKTRAVPCDAVLNDVGFRSNDQLENVLPDSYDNVKVIGNAVEPRKILDAVHEGYHAVRVIE